MDVDIFFSILLYNI